MFKTACGVMLGLYGMGIGEFNNTLFLILLFSVIVFSLIAELLKKGGD